MTKFVLLILGIIMMLLNIVSCIFASQFLNAFPRFWITGMVMTIINGFLVLGSLQIRVWSFLSTILDNFNLDTRMSLSLLFGEPS